MKSIDLFESIAGLAASIEDVKETPFEELRRIISRFSERKWCAGWRHDVEYIVWEDINNAGFLSDLTGKERFRINELHELLQGWVRWDDNLKDEVFVPLDEWIVLYNRWKEKKSK